MSPLGGATDTLPDDTRRGDDEAGPIGTASEGWMDIRVQDVMQTEVHTVDPEMSAVDLEQAFLQHRVGGFPVVERGELVGIISRSDIVRRLSVEQAYDDHLSDYYREISFGSTEESAGARAERGARVGARIEGLVVRDLMVQAVITAAADDPVQELARQLVARHIHRVPVTKDGALVGIVTTLDLVRLVAEGRLQPA
jgi:CBS domain-containing protein